MKRSLYGHALVVVIMAVASYAAWTAPKDKGNLNKTTVIAGNIEQLTTLRWQEERWDVLLSRNPKNEFEVTVQGQEPSPKEDAASTSSDEKGDPKPSPGGEETQTPKPAKTFPASDKVEKLLERLVPLETRRALGEVASERLTPMGLTEPASHLTLTFGEREHSVEVGGSTYGSGDLYARVDGEVFLIPSSALSSLRHGGSSLLDKSAVGVPRQDVTRVTITAGARGREIAQRHSDAQNKRFFSDPAEPEVKLEMVTNWLERVWRLRVVEMETEAQPSMVPPVVEIEMFAGPESLGVLRLWSPGERHAVATSTRFPQPFTVSRASAEAILKDLDGVLDEGL